MKVKYMNNVYCHNNSTMIYNDDEMLCVIFFFNFAYYLTLHQYSGPYRAVTLP